MDIFLNVVILNTILECLTLKISVTAIDLESAKCIYSINRHLDCKNRGLTKIPDSFQSDVKSIDLSENVIKNIPRHSFKDLDDLEEINLSYNIIDKIETFSFVSLPSLQTLAIRSNNLKSESIKDGAFCNVTSLQTLDAALNHFWTTNDVFTPRLTKYMQNLKVIHFDAFQAFRYSKLEQELNLTNIQEIEMTQIGTDTRYISFTLQNVSFEGASRLKSLKIVFSKIEVGALQHFSSLDFLTLRMTGYYDIVDEVFLSLKSFAHRNLTFLKITGNSFRYSFRLTGKKHLKYLSLICIQRLSLKDNYIKDIESQYFEKFATDSICLKDLDFSVNMFDPGTTGVIFMLRLFENLEIVRFSHAKMFQGNVNTHPMCSCADPQAIDFSVPFSLHELHLSYLDLKNRITVLNIKGGHNVRILDLAHVPYCSCRLLFKGLPNLEYLDTSGFTYHSFNEKFFTYLPNLKYFASQNSYLGIGFQTNNLIGTIFRNSSKLETLDLVGNNIQKIPGDIFNPLKNLVSLTLSRNKLKVFPLELHNFKHLSLIDLQNNELTHIGEKFRKSIDKSRNIIIKLKGNPFLCTCSMLPSIKWLNLSNIQDFNELTCSMEDGQNLFIKDFVASLQAFEDSCVNRFWTKFGIVLACIIFMVMCTVCIYWKFKINIQYKWCMLKKLLNPSRSIPNTGDFLFAAFGSYSSKDWDKISPIYHFLAANGVNICIPDKHFVPGKLIIDNIIDSIDNSRKVIFFITENFLRSEWASYEVQISLLHASKRNDDNMIVLIKKDNIPFQSLPRDLSNAWLNRTGIKWPLVMTNNDQLQRFHQRILRCFRNNGT